VSAPTIETVVLLIRVGSTLTPYTVRIDFTDRQELKKTHFYECGVSYPCHTWKRVDGEIDCYPEVLAEARRNGLNPELKLKGINYDQQNNNKKTIQVHDFDQTSQNDNQTVSQ
jgi:hypothetical protein